VSTLELQSRVFLAKGEIHNVSEPANTACSYFGGMHPSLDCCPLSHVLGEARCRLTLGTVQMIRGEKRFALDNLTLSVDLFKEAKDQLGQALATYASFLAKHRLGFSNEKTIRLGSLDGLDTDWGVVRVKVSSLWL
jgi:hypothetical protein